MLWYTKIISRNSNADEVASGDKDKHVNHNNYSRMDLSKSFAQLSLPGQLQLQERGINRKLGVTAKSAIKASTQFGPLQGEQILLRDIPDDFEMKELWQVGRTMYKTTNKFDYLSNVFNL